MMTTIPQRAILTVLATGPARGRMRITRKGKKKYAHPVGMNGNALNTLHAEGLITITWENDNYTYSITAAGRAAY